MRSRGAGRFRHWIRSNVFDGWQVAGALGLLIGASLVVALMLNAKHRLPTTSAAIQLVQTVGSEAQQLVPGLSPSPEPSASPSTDQGGGGVTQTQPLVKPTTSRTARRAGPTATSSPSGSTPTAVSTPTPISTATPRPCLDKLCPTLPPAPTPTPRPCLTKGC